MKMIGKPIVNQTLYGKQFDEDLDVKFLPIASKQPGYKTIWSLVLATEVPLARKGDWLDVRWGLTLDVGGKMFRDRRNKATYAVGSVDLPVYVQVHTEPLDQVLKLPGYSVPRTAGPNGNHQAHYIPKGDAGWIEVKKEPVWVLVYFCPESEGVRWTKAEPQIVRLYGGNYNHTQVVVWRPEDGDAE